MNQRLLRLLDAWIGKTLCWLLTQHRWLMTGDEAAANTATAPAAPSSILFIKLIEQGASVLAVDAFQAAINMVGAANVYVCVFVENRPILDLLGMLPAQNIWTIRNKRLLSCTLDLIAMLRRARRIGLAATVDLELFSRGSAIIAYLTGATARVGLHRFTMDGPYRGDLMTHRISYNPYIHTAKSYRLLVDALAPSGRDPRAPSGELINKHPLPRPLADLPRFQPTTTERESVEALLVERLGRALPPGPRLLLNPNASDLMPLRKWPTPRFIELAQRLLAHFPDATVIFTGAPGERAESEIICAALASDRVISVAGHTTLRQLLTLFTTAQVLVTNDSGPGHFASMTDLTNIVLFGPETPDLYGPVAGRPSPLSARLACSPCVNALNHRLSPCTNNRCMQAISVDQVFQIVVDGAQQHTASHAGDGGRQRGLQAL